MTMMITDTNSDNNKIIITIVMLIMLSTVFVKQKFRIERVTKSNNIKCTVSRTHASTHARTHARTHAHKRKHACGTRARARTHTHTHTHTHARTHARPYTHTHTQACTTHTRSSQSQPKTLMSPRAFLLTPSNPLTAIQNQPLHVFQHLIFPRVVTL